MAGYYFEIKGIKGTEELGGMDFSDDAAAVAFGKGVIQDLIHRGLSNTPAGRLRLRTASAPLALSPSKPMRADAARGSQNGESPFRGRLSWRNRFSHLLP
jgi:hypothetical protein